MAGQYWLSPKPYQPTLSTRRGAPGDAGIGLRASSSKCPKTRLSVLECLTGCRASSDPCARFVPDAPHDFCERQPVFYGKGPAIFIFRSDSCHIAGHAFYLDPRRAQRCLSLDSTVTHSQRGGLTQDHHSGLICIAFFDQHRQQHGRSVLLHLDRCHPHI